MTRPKITAETIIEAAKRTEAETPSLSEQDREDLAEAIEERYSHHISGFELAAALDRDGWSGIDSMFVESMDHMSDQVDEINREDQKKWVAWQNIQPPHPIGAMTTKGEITGICDYYPASYLVKEPGQIDGENRTSRRIVKFEDATLRADK